MIKFFLQICFFICLTVYASEAEHTPEVEIVQGRLKGKYQQTWKGRPFSAFAGIPYAKPPVGNLRFKPPVPAEAWNGLLDASKPSSICPQMNIFLNDYTVRGDEDCLYLNVYTPQLPDPSNKPLPVMFYIHGGGLMYGSGNPDLYGPDILLDKDVVLVTINYRLGALGFLSTEDEVVPGNNGLKDQNLALRWVKNNIAHFGGNPDKITVFGQSSGGASTHYHVLSPLSRDLFVGAIAHSGTAVASWALAQKGHAVENAKKLAQLLNCPTGSNHEMVECLSKVNAYDIVEQDKEFVVYSYDPVIPFKPVIEPDVEGAFLTEDPIDIIKSGKAANVPFITGLTTEDGALKSAALYNDSNLIEELNKNFSRIIPLILQYEIKAENKDFVNNQIREFYFGNKSIDDSTKSELTDLITDIWFLHPQNLAVRLHAMYSKQPVYDFLFGYRGSVSFTTIYGDSSHNYGVCHGDELLYLFSTDLFPNYEPNASEKELIDTMTTLWTNFAATGNPTPQTDTLIKTKWLPVQGDSLSYYFIKSANDTEMANDLYKERSEFWESLPIGSRRYRTKNEL